MDRLLSETLTLYWVCGLFAAVTNDFNMKCPEILCEWNQFTTKAMTLLLFIFIQGVVFQLLMHRKSTEGNIFKSICAINILIAWCLLASWKLLNYRWVQCYI